MGSPDTLDEDARTRYGLGGIFLNACARFPDRPALQVEGRVLSYRDLLDRAAALACAIDDRSRPRKPFVGVNASRSVDAYAAILATLLSGRAVVPLNAGFPAERIKSLIDETDLDTIVLDDGTAARVDGLLDAVDRRLTVIIPGSTAIAERSRRWPEHRFVESTRLAAAPGWKPCAVSLDANAYLFFTSGSTGRPKGVEVRHRNAIAFVNMWVAHYRTCGLGEHERFSQFYELSFDASMSDLYTCWAFGACVCCPSLGEWINPNKYIEDEKLTVIDIVPSTGHSMNRKGAWRPGRFPHLKLCRLSAEALPAQLCAALAEAAPNAVVENVYGPTECCVEVCYYRWDRSRSPAECEHGMVPIGYPGPGVEMRVVDETLRDLPPGEMGELLIGGPQVTPGYWRDPEKTQAAFVELPGGQGRYYRTGDLVRQRAPGAPFVFLGRFDHQIKIAGVRIELGEIEMALRDVAGTDGVVAMGCQLTSNGATGIVAFVVNSSTDVATIHERLKARLPQVMIPREIRLLDEFPRNPNGKVDRNVLIARLSGEDR
jgi:amino acid adenylation domain-containing protein